MTTATYTLRADGDIDVLNRCRKGTVDFFGPFSGDYWMLARTPTMPEATYQSLVTRLQAQGYDTSRLVRTLQVGGPPPAGESRSPERN